MGLRSRLLLGIVVCAGQWQLARLNCLRVQGFEGVRRVWNPSNSPAPRSVRATLGNLTSCWGLLELLFASLYELTQCFACPSRTVVHCCSDCFAHLVVQLNSRQAVQHHLHLLRVVGGVSVAAANVLELQPELPVEEAQDFVGSRCR